MFTRAAKSVVKNLGQRKYYGGEDNLKVTIIGAAGEVGQTLSHFVKNASKLESSLVRDSNPVSRFPTFHAEKTRSPDTSTSSKVQDSRTENYHEKSHRKHAPTFVSSFPNRELDLERTVNELRDKEIKLLTEDAMKKQTKTPSQRSITSFTLAKPKTTELMGVLGRVSATPRDSTVSQSRQVGQTMTFTPITTQACDACRVVCSNCRTEDPCDEDNPCNKKERKRQKPIERQGNPCKKGKTDPCKEKKDDCPPVNRAPECPGK